jgi:hypothetical protein
MPFNQADRLIETMVKRNRRLARLDASSARRSLVARFLRDTRGSIPFTVQPIVGRLKRLSLSHRPSALRSLVTRFVRDNQASVPFTAEPPAAKRDRRSDLTVAALGITLGLICALFPWYIFFNQDDFGVRAMKFEGSNADAGPILLGSQPKRVGAPIALQEIPPVKLDLLPTGTARNESGEDEHGTPGLTEQPFPSAPVDFKLVHVANGRALMEDDSGLFVVERGTVLPDSSRVASIEQRDGRWRLVTDTGLVIDLTQ